MRMEKCPGQHWWLPLWGNVVLGVAAAIVDALDGQLKDPDRHPTRIATPLLASVYFELSNVGRIVYGRHSPDSL